jgi:plasmid maintenance system killer protein
VIRILKALKSKAFNARGGDRNNLWKTLINYKYHSKILAAKILTLHPKA